jgi:hypothetical protein
MTKTSILFATFIAIFHSVPALAEAGLPYSFCGQQSCACGAATCGCGQVCNLNQQRCESAQIGFCSSDSACAASCDRFICEMNVCVRGTRDGGSSTALDSGTMSGTDSGVPTSPKMPPTSGGCTSIPSLIAIVAIALRRRK